MATRYRRARVVLATFVAMLMVVAVAAPVGAALPQSLTLVSTTIFNPSGPNFGTFTATGAAVDNGLVCAAGSFVDTGLKFAGYENNKAVQLQVSKTYSCSNGDFFVKMQIHANFDGTEVFTWVVEGGTGGYATLHGSGSGTTADNPPTGNINTFVGSFH